MHYNSHGVSDTSILVQWTKSIYGLGAMIIVDKIKNYIFYKLAGYRNVVHPIYSKHYSCLSEPRYIFFNFVATVLSSFHITQFDETFFWSLVTFLRRDT